MFAAQTNLNKYLMKKFLTIAAIALFTLTACSDDDAQPTNSGENPTDTILLRKVISFNPISQQQEESIYTYDNQNRLISITESETAEGSYFTYTGNKITKSEIKDSEGIVFQTYTYEYDTNGRLVVYKSFGEIGPGATTFKDVFIYNEDGTISTTQYSGDQNSQPNVGASAVFYLNGGNIVKKVVTPIYPGGAPAPSFTINYTFDNKFTPSRNIPGMSETTIADQDGGVNNVTSTDYVESNDYDSTITYTYNSAGYPLTSQGSSTWSSSNITQYFYE